MIAAHAYKKQERFITRMTVIQSASVCVAGRQVAVGMELYASAPELIVLLWKSTPPKLPIGDGEAFFVFRARAPQTRNKLACGLSIRTGGREEEE